MVCNCNGAGGGEDMNAHENLLKKYGISEKELNQKGIDIVSKNLGKICDPLVLLAVTELLVSGDIPAPK